MLVQFVADTLFKTLVAVPVVGGLVLVALVVGGNPFDLLRLDDLTQTISTMVGVLLAQPVALAAFAVALGIIVAGGSIMMFAVKAGTRDGAARRRSRGGQRSRCRRFGMSALREANQTTLERFTTGVRVLFFAISAPWHPADDCLRHHRRRVYRARVRSIDRAGCSTIR